MEFPAVDQVSWFLILRSKKKRFEDSNIISQIRQKDGQALSLLDDLSFTFKSDYGEEDIHASLEEIFPPFVTSLNSRVRLGRLEADVTCFL